jgi:hypothetical protein
MPILCGIAGIQVEDASQMDGIRVLRRFRSVPTRAHRPCYAVAVTPNTQHYQCVASAHSPLPAINKRMLYFRSLYIAGR